MPKYVIERGLEGVGEFTPDQLRAVSAKSCAVLQAMGPQIHRIHGYVTEDKVYCPYVAPNEQAIREHARQGGFPAKYLRD